MQTNPPVILLTGKSGQVGFELCRSLSSLGHLVSVDRRHCDLSDTQAIHSLLNSVRPHIIINPAAYTAVDRAEKEQDLAFAINTIAPQMLAEYAADTGALLIHYSTDYIFNGNKAEAYIEDDPAAPQSVYGKTKWEGEQIVRNTCKNHIIFRTSWVYGAYGNNFLKTILRLAEEKEQLNIVTDQIGAPTSASLIADITAYALVHYLNNNDNDKLYGTYHLSPKGYTTWYQYAIEIITKAIALGYPLKLQIDNINPITTAEYPLPAKRPKNSRLETNKIEKTFNLYLPAWQDGIMHTLSVLKQSVKI